MLVRVVFLQLMWGVSKLNILNRVTLLLCCYYWGGWQCTTTFILVCYCIMSVYVKPYNAKVGSWVAFITRNKMCVCIFLTFFKDKVTIFWKYFLSGSTRILPNALYFSAFSRANFVFSIKLGNRHKTWQ